MKRNVFHKALQGAIALLMGGAASLAAATTPAPSTEAVPLQPGQEYMVVVNRPNHMHVLDLATNSVLKTCPLPGAFGPAVTQVAPDRRSVYVLNNRFGDIYGIDVDSCRVNFHARMSLADNERAKSIFSFTVSADGKELYAVQNPTTLYNDHYRVGEPRFVVYDTAAGLDAKPLRSFPAPRQSTIMQAAPDGSLYLAGPNLYKVDVHTGSMSVVLPIRDWQRPLYAPLDVLYVWPVQTPSRDFSLLYTTAKFKDEKMDPASADYQYGLLNINLLTGEAEAREFGPLTEIYFTGVRSPKERNVIFGVLHRLAKYDLQEQKLIQATELEHTYYTALINHAGDRVYLTGTFNDVSIHDADSLKKVGSIQLPGGDMSLGTAQVFIR